MKRTFSLITYALAVLAMGGCTDPLLVEWTPEGAFSPKGNPVEVYLDLSVESFSSEATTRGDGQVSEDTEAERRITNIWVLQYDQKTGTLISEPKYIEIKEQPTLTNVPDTLSDNNNEPCVVYVVANTNSDSWITYDTETKTYSGVGTLEELKKFPIPNSAPIMIVEKDVGVQGETTEANLAIPMGGSLGEDGDLSISEGYHLTVPVRRMFAKLLMKVTLDKTDTPNIQEASVTSLMVEKIPNTCTVATTYYTTDINDDGEEVTKWYYPTVSSSNYEISRSFTPDDDTTDDSTEDEIVYGPFLLYVPENCQGTETTNAIKLTPSIYLKIGTEGTEGAEIVSRPSYTAYPGSWDETLEEGEESGENFDIKRNSVYNISITVTPDEENPTPSANCLISSAEKTIAFYPYVRDEVPTTDMESEHSGRYDFTTYLNSSYTDENNSKRIASVRIIWQTYNCIGDNSDGKLVWIDSAPEETFSDEEKSYYEYRRKIYVTTPKSGNALIGAFDKEGNVLWSWHIWVPENDPEERAIDYYHYRWTSAGIETTNFEVGRTVMRLNLGALQEEPTLAGAVNFKTYGTIYQWGRKDPFPPITSQDYRYVANTTVYKGGSPQFFNYEENYSFSAKTSGATTDNRQYTVHIGVGGDETNTYGVYDNENKAIDLQNYDGSMQSTNREKLKFNTNSAVTSIKGTLTGGDDAVIQASIQDPTMFIAAAGHFTDNSSDVGQANNISSYYNEGDWLPDGDDFLWGGGHTTSVEKYHVYSQGTDGLYTNQSFDAYLEDDYGPNKTIFDPCPYGWRVAPGDLWLGFTSNGANWVHNSSTAGSTPDDYWDDINCKDKDMATVNYQNGYTMYMQGWRTGQTSFFPVQPARVPSGQPYLNGGICGNYHNATVDEKMHASSWATDQYIRRVDILHFHAESSTYGMVKPFTNELYYYTKSVAGPLRCVRDTK